MCRRGNGINKFPTEQTRTARRRIRAQCQTNPAADMARAALCAPKPPMPIPPLHSPLNLQSADCSNHPHSSARHRLPCLQAPPPPLPTSDFRKELLTASPCLRLCFHCSAVESLSPSQHLQAENASSKHGTRHPQPQTTTMRSGAPPLAERRTPHPGSGRLLDRDSTRG